LFDLARPDDMTSPAPQGRQLRRILTPPAGDPPLRRQALGNFESLGPQLTVPRHENRQP
jgi:hypothetical protein